MKGLHVFFVLLLLSTMADGFSTFRDARERDDWNLAMEANPSIRGTSLEAMVWQGVRVTLLMTVVFGVAWDKRRDLYPQEPACSFSEFWHYLKFGVIPALSQHSKYPRLRFGLIFCGVCVPIAFILGRLKAALLNTLVTAGIITGRTQTVVLFEHVVLAVPSILLGVYVLHLNHRYIVRAEGGDRSGSPGLIR